MGGSNDSTGIRVDTDSAVNGTEVDNPDHGDQHPQGEHPQDERPQE